MTHQSPWEGHGLFKIQFCAEDGTVIPLGQQLWRLLSGPLAAKGSLWSRRRMLSILWYALKLQASFSKCSWLKYLLSPSMLWFMTSLIIFLDCLNIAGISFHLTLSLAAFFYHLTYTLLLAFCNRQACQSSLGLNSSCNLDETCCWHAPQWWHPGRIWSLLYLCQCQDFCQLAYTYKCSRNAL